MTDLARATGLENVSRETIDRLEAYAALLTRWNTSINLVSNASLSDLWTRHFADSAQLAGELRRNPPHWVDLGSGGGFPGLVLAVLAQEIGVSTRFTLIESDQRKCAFLSTAARTLEVDVQILPMRIEDAAPQGADVISARALAPLKVLMGFTEIHLRDGGIALFAKGRSHAREVAEALALWSFDCEESASITDPDAAILRIGAIRRV